MSSLVIYFSRAGENYFGGELKNIEKGNTEVIAEYIQEFADADLFKVEPAVSTLQKRNYRRMKGLKSGKAWMTSQLTIRFI